MPNEIDNQIRERVTRVLRQEGLHLDVETALGFAHESASDAALASIFHEKASRLGAASSDPNLPAALRDPAFRASLGGLGNVDAWNKLSLQNRQLLQSRFAAQVAIAAGPSSLQAFEREMVAKYGSDFRTMLTPTQKTTYAQLTGSRAAPGVSYAGRLHQEREQLLASRSGSDNLNITQARARRIAQIERDLGIKS